MFIARTRGGWLPSSTWASCTFTGYSALASSSIRFGRWSCLDIVSPIFSFPMVTLTLLIAADGRPLPNQMCTLDMPDDFFRIRLVCVLLDTCGMCFDLGTQKKKLDNFLTFFQVNAACPSSSL
jgi:hypothetical protein